MGAVAEAVEAPSAMDGSQSADGVEKLFSFSSAFGRAAVAIDQFGIFRKRVASAVDR